MWGNGFHSSWGGMGVGMIGMALFWILVVVALALLLRNLWRRSPGSQRPPPKTSLEILEERYARGEIDKKEFEEKRRALTK